MNITTYFHRNVAPDGKVEGGGAVEVRGRIAESVPSGGCGAGECNCSPCHWISRAFPRTENGSVFGYKVRFDSRAELDQADLYAIELEALKYTNLAPEVAEKIRVSMSDAKQGTADLLRRVTGH